MIPLLWCRSLGIILRIVKRISYYLPIPFRLKDICSKIVSQQAPLHVTQSDDGYSHPPPLCIRVSTIGYTKQRGVNRSNFFGRINSLNINESVSIHAPFPIGDISMVFPKSINDLSSLAMQFLRSPKLIYDAIVIVTATKAFKNILSFL